MQPCTTAGASAPPPLDEWEWDIPATVDYLLERRFASAALQFPDELLGHCADVARALQAKLGGACKVYVLADSSYNPLAVDEVAAAHVSAQCIVHYGPASLTPVNSLPVFFVFPKSRLPDAQTAMQELLDTVEESESLREKRALVLLVDQAYQHVQDQMVDALRQECAARSTAAGAGGASAPSARAVIAAAAAARTMEPVRGVTAAVNMVAANATQANAASANVAAPSTSPQPVGACGGSCSDVAGSCGSGAGNQGMGRGSCGAERLSGCEGIAEASSAAGGSCHTAATGSAPDGPRQGCQAAGCREANGCGTQTAVLAPASSTRQGSHAEAGPIGAGRRNAGGAGVGVVGGVAGVRWQLPDGCSESDAALVWFGPAESPLLRALQLAHSTAGWLVCEPIAAAAGGAAGSAAGGAAGGGSSGGGDACTCLSIHEGLLPGTMALLKRRYYLVEKAKDAQIMGILVGTLACAGFLDAVNLVRQLAREAGKKTYQVVMGKPSPAKLANFPEVEVFVMIADPLGFLLDSKEFLSPIITPHEAFLALTGRSLDPSARYPLDFQEAIVSHNEREAADGGSGGERSGDGDDNLTSRQLVAFGGLSVAGPAGGGGRVAIAKDAAEYFALRRSYKGLETPLTGAEVLRPAAPVDGRSGRAAGYDDEPATR